MPQTNNQATLYELFHTDDLVELFEILDVDGGGSAGRLQVCIATTCYEALGT